MRNISFALTTGAIEQREKRVTRRSGKSWAKLKPGDLLCAIEKGQGLKKGETIRRLAIIRVVSVRREPLSRMTDEPGYGRVELALEGFAGHESIRSPEAFVRFYMAHNGCLATDTVTRIEFTYQPGLPEQTAARPRQRKNDGARSPSAITST